MPIVPVRDLASKGVLRDPSPYQLDLNAWSGGMNVRFHANRAERAPIYRTVYNEFPDTPVFCVGYEPSTGYDKVTVAAYDWRLWQYLSGSVTEVTPAGCIGSVSITNGGSGYSASAPPTVTFSAPPSGGVQATGVGIVNSSGSVVGVLLSSPGQGYTSAPTATFAAPGSGTTATASATLWTSGSTSSDAFTATFLGDVQYLNRPDMAPVFFGPTSVTFAPLPNMECAWTCRSMRAWSDYLIALNVTKPETFTDPYSGLTLSGGALPNLFKWSDLTLDGQVPDAWDPDNPNTSAGENPLEELTTPLVDGVPMRNIFVVYSENEIWAAEQTYDNNIFAFARLFSTGGLLNVNCAVEVDGVHYCFGPKDIYKHDGVTKLSIVDKRNKNTVFRNLNVQKSGVCFVAYVPHLDSVFFCYNTQDTTAFFQGVPYCNQAFVYDIPNDTGAFIDLPNVTAATMANLNTVLTWASVPSTTTWANVGGSWADQSNTYVKSSVWVSALTSGYLTYNRIAAYDFMNKGWLALPYEPEMNPQAYVQRTGIALDQVGSDLTTYKLLRCIFPEVVIYDDVPVQVILGYSMTPSGAVTWQPAVSFDPTSDYKVDVMNGGRYLAIQFTVNQPVDFEIAGYDMDLQPWGRR